MQEKSFQIGTHSQNDTIFVRIFSSDIQKWSNLGENIGTIFVSKYRKLNKKGFV